MAAASYILSCVLFLTFSGIVLSQGACFYTIAVKTGTRSGAGTNAKVSLTMSNMEESPIRIPNLETHGLMEPRHDYFENGNLDFFSLEGPCFTFPVCYILLGHDNTGYKPGWYVQYVRITTNGGAITPPTIVFNLEQWLYKDPTSRDLCPHRQKSNGGIASVVDASV